ncbi:MAG: hypothetical protein ABF593_04835 [Acetobacter papayae]|uniref:hypothetical protein n=1 Tax=Acetobacter papayae TaxID=1076592 RepID=UPI0039E76832
MTDPRIEAAARALFGDRVDASSGTREYLFEEVSKALAAADAAAWRPMSEAPKDRTPIIAKTRSDVFPESSNRSGWNGRHAVIQHGGILDDGFDMGWSVAAPVGYGGMPDGWFLGWQPISDFPEKEPLSAPETITIPEVRNDRPIPEIGETHS